MKARRILAVLLTFLMTFGLMAVTQSVFAAANWTRSYDMSAMMGSSDNGRHGSTTTSDYNTKNVFGKGDNGVLKLAAHSGNADYYLGIGTADMTFGANTKTVISYDVAFDSFYDASANHAGELQIANSSGSLMATLRLIHVNKNGTLNSLDQEVSGRYVKTGVWNNVTAVIEIGKDGKTYTCEVYLNGEHLKGLKNGSDTLSSEAAYIRSLRLCDRTAAPDTTAETASQGGQVFIDDLKITSYPSSDSVDITFADTAAATEGNEALVDSENAVIALGSDVNMTVAQFKEKTTGFAVLDSTGAAAADDALLRESVIYSIVSNGTGSYYKSYTSSVSDPVITVSDANINKIVNGNLKTISVVDCPGLTAGEFLAGVSGAKVMNGDTQASANDLLGGCKVYATYGEGYEALDIEYSVVTERTYYINDGINGTVTNVTSNGKTAYSVAVGENDAMNFNAYRKDNSTTTVAAVGGLGGKAEDDTALTMQRTGYSYVAGTNDPFFITSVPSSVTGSFTLEFKILASITDEDVTTRFDILLKGNKQAIIFEGVKNAAGQRVINVLTPQGTYYTMPVPSDQFICNEWVPVAFVYNAPTDSYDIWINGRCISEDISCGNIARFSDIRFRCIMGSGSGADATLAIDDIKLYTDELEKYSVKYTKDGAETSNPLEADAVSVSASQSYYCLPILAKYRGNELVSFKFGGMGRTITMPKGEADETVKFMLWTNEVHIKPIQKADTMFTSDGDIPVTSYKVILSNAFDDGMVIQRGEPVRVWGTSDGADGSAVSVTLGDMTEETVVADGKWSVSFPSQLADSNGKTIIVSGGDSYTTVNNVRFGDVYFVGGQSNAALAFSGTDTYDADRYTFFDSDTMMLYQPAVDTCTKPQAELSSGCEWGAPASATLLPRYSALGVYFGEYLADGLSGENDVPIGLIQVTRSGSSLYEHVSEEIYNKYNPTYLNTQYKSRVYNANIAPVINFAARGLVWYQGENESISSIINTTTQTYSDMFADYVAQFNRTDDFEVFVVQLSSHTTATDNSASGWNVPRFRAYQYDMAVKNGYHIIPSLDYGVKTGDSDPAHPKYKKPLGERVANEVLAVMYNQSSYAAPLYESVTYNDDKVIIKFANSGTGLKLMTGDTLVGFELIKDGVATAATAVITGTDTVEITGVSGATGVRYAFYRSAPKTVANLANSYGVACPTFVHTNDGTNGAAIDAISFGEME